MQAQQACVQLADRLGGRWVVFVEGQLESDHATAEQAHKAALLKHGAGGGYMIAHVPPPANSNSSAS